ncbi:MAG: hypothetical protein ACRC17_11520 [Culicoidibacterales bacterium]
MIKSNINYLLEKDEKKKKQIAIDAHQLGLVEGKLEGKVEGKLEVKLEVAQKMLALMDDQTIAEITGLAIADIIIPINRTAKILFVVLLFPPQKIELLYCLSQ